MPTLAQLQIPATKSWDEFEDIVTDCFRIRWGNPNLTRHGRQGQTQLGVDIYGLDDLGRLVGIQCKLTHDKITTALIDKEIENAKKFGDLTALYFATTSPRDAKIQRYILDKSSKEPFNIGIAFWDDLIFDLSRDSEALKKHYPQLNIQDDIAGSTNRAAKMLSLIDLAYYGTQLTHYMGLLFGGLDTGESEDFHRICGAISSASNSFQFRKSFISISKLSGDLDGYVMPWVRGDEERPGGWVPANAIAEELEMRIGNLRHELPDYELVAFRIGETISIWSRNLIGNASYLLSDNGERNILAAFKKLHPDDKIALDVYNILQEGKQDKAGNVFLPDQLIGFAKEVIYNI